MAKRTRKNSAGGVKLRHLGRKSERPVERVDLIPLGLDATRPSVVTLHAHEFTSLCPVTGQADFGEITIIYEPDEYLIETKSLKLFLFRLRLISAFNEQIVASICNDLFGQVQPTSIVVVGEFKQRGGISVRAEARKRMER